MIVHTKQSAGADGGPPSRLRSAAEFWAGYEVIRANRSETHAWTVLEGLYAEYHDILSRDPIDLGRIESLTAEAALWMLGKRAY